MQMNENDWFLGMHLSLSFPPRVGRVGSSATPINCSGDHRGVSSGLWAMAHAPTNQEDNDASPKISLP